MILTKFDPPVKILRVKSGLWKFEGSNRHPVKVLHAPSTLNYSI
jgi:hypothetical protein